LVLAWFNCWVRWTYDLGGFKLMLEGSTLLGDTKEHKICLVFQFGTPSLLA